MAIFYLDYEGGNDANDGTTFANRWKTFTSGATAARIAPGDTIRVMGSPAPTSLGINATWTNKSATVTLASALNALITNCDSVWTASANVTAATNGTTYRTGSVSVQHNIAAGFTTGKVAYFDLGSNQNYSAYQGVTFWFFVSLGTLGAGVLDLNLCSDTTGDVPVDTFSIPALAKTSQWIPVYINKGSALGSAIRSISISAVSDPGTINFLIDNISTTKASGNDCLTLQSLIGKNTTDEYWWAIRGINGTAITLDHSPNGSASATARGYYGTTGSVATYKRETIKTDLVTNTTDPVQAVQDNGTVGSLITFSGGWNRTDMTTQVLETWFDGQSGYGYGIDWNTKNYVSIDQIWAVRYGRGFLINGQNNEAGKIYAGNCTTSGMNINAPTTFTANELHSWGCHASAYENTNGDGLTVTKMRGVSGGSGTPQSAWATNSSALSGNWVIGTLELSNSAWVGFYLGSGTLPLNVSIGTLNVHDNAQSGFASGGGNVIRRWVIGTINANSNGAQGVYLSGLSGGDLMIGTINAANNSSSGLNLADSGISCTIGSLVTSGNSSGITLSLLYGRIAILSSSIAEATKISASSYGWSSGYVSLVNYLGVAGDHRTWYAGGGDGSGLGTIFSETTVRHTASGLAWKLSPRSTAVITATWPMALPIAKIAVNASALVTVKLWMRRTNTGLTGTLRCRGGQIAGVSADVTDSITAIADTWEERTITFTPSAAGVVEIDVLCYGGTTYSLYIDDMTVTQA